MKIIAIEHTVPQKILSNEEVIDRVISSSKPNLTDAECNKIASHLNSLFKSAGLKTRHVTNGQERPIDLVTDAAERALRSAGLAASELDFIIYGGVARGYLVPSSASAIQYALGASGVDCFDILDSCASWARALQVANSFLRNDPSMVGLIVNCECGFYADYDVWSIRSVNDIKTEGGFFTIGEAATATVVGSANGGPEAEFHSFTYGEYGDLAVLPILESEGYMTHKRQPHGPLRFYTQTNELTFNGFRIGRNLMKKIDPLKGRPVDAFVPHAGAAPSVGMFMKATGIKADELVMSFRDYGNTVSASIPLGLSLATGDGRISRGDRVFCSTIAAGLSVVSILFTY